MDQARKAVKSGWNTLGDTIRYLFPEICTFCYYPVVHKKDASNLQMMFCSMNCYTNFVRQTQRQDYWKCLLPGCERVRAQKNYNEYYDYCGRSHATTHTDQLRQMYYERKHVKTSINYSRTNSTGPILFYSKDEPYYEFTNFALIPIFVDGSFYTTSEHYFQAQKLVGTPYESYVAKLPRPRDAFEFPRQAHIAQWIRKDWNDIKEKIMYRGLCHKFGQHEHLKKLLLNTGQRELKEDSPYDSYWGIGSDHKGLNRLGVLLMRLRDALRGNPYIDRVSTDGEQHFSPQTNRTNFGNDSSAVGLMSNQVDYFQQQHDHTHDRDTSNEFPYSSDQENKRDSVIQDSKTVTNKDPTQPGSIQSDTSKPNMNPLTNPITFDTVLGASNNKQSNNMSIEQTGVSLPILIEPQQNNDSNQANSPVPNTSDIGNTTNTVHTDSPPGLVPNASDIGNTTNTVHTDSPPSLVLNASDIGNTTNTVHNNSPVPNASDIGNTTNTVHTDSPPGLVPNASDIGNTTNTVHTDSPPSLVLNASDISNTTNTVHNNNPVLNASDIGNTTNTVHTDSPPGLVPNASDIGNTTNTVHTDSPPGLVLNASDIGNTTNTVHNNSPVLNASDIGNTTNTVHTDSPPGLVPNASDIGNTTNTVHTDSPPGLVLNASDISNTTNTVHNNSPVLNASDIGNTTNTVHTDSPPGLVPNASDIGNTTNTVHTDSPPGLVLNASDIGNTTNTVHNNSPVLNASDIGNTTNTVHTDSPPGLVPNASDIGNTTNTVHTDSPPGLVLNASDISNTTNTVHNNSPVLNASDIGNTTNTVHTDSPPGLVPNASDIGNTTNTVHTDSPPGLVLNASDIGNTTNTVHNNSPVLNASDIGNTTNTVHTDSPPGLVPNASDIGNTTNTVHTDSPPGLVEPTEEIVSETESMDIDSTVSDMEIEN